MNQPAARLFASTSRCCWLKQPTNSSVRFQRLLLAQMLSSISSSFSQHLLTSTR